MPKVAEKPKVDLPVPAKELALLTLAQKKHLITLAISDKITDVKIALIQKAMNLNPIFAEAVYKSLLQREVPIIMCDEDFRKKVEILHAEKKNQYTGNPYSTLQARTLTGAVLISLESFTNYNMRGQKTANFVPVFRVHAQGLNSFSFNSTNDITQPILLQN